ncbi:aminoglycoside phosphotransferase family protein [Streptomyces sp. NBC_01410]|uniref:phosphotransferase n=1 Tax=Streptomyces sp. NBC_01410 TaxID=2903856 RepID=UPI00324E2696
MAGHTASEVHRQAAELSGGARGIVGPLKGYHHETYALPLPEENLLSARYARGKLRAPRPGVLWFDRRCFTSEDRLLMALQGRIDRIPETVEVAENVFLQGFIEGRTLARWQLPGRSLAAGHVLQLRRLFRELVTIKVDELKDVPRTCETHGQRPACDDDSTAFLSRLIDFTGQRVYDDNAEQYGTLFEELGVRREALAGLGDSATLLTSRPFTLIHGDLHRHNFIVDTAGALWTIDWELAMIGDPLYELATHLHLMRYSPREEARIAELWAQEVEAARPGSSASWQQDLPRLLAYKRTQSVFTDVIRTAEALGPRTDPNWRALPRAAWKIRRALAAARDPLELKSVPTLRQVVSAYTRWFRLPGDQSAPPRA